MNYEHNPFLVSGAALSALAAMLHLACIAGGASWYRFFGAGERMAQMALSGSKYPAILTLAIASVLALWSLYALAAAGVFQGLPFMRAVLCLITGVYLLRGMAATLLTLLDLKLGRSMAFWWWSSAVCLSIGTVHLIGLKQVWAQI